MILNIPHWGANIAFNHYYLSVLVPTDTGFTVADELQDMPGTRPTVARDQNLRSLSLRLASPSRKRSSMRSRIASF